jgi:hypothetical protein
VLWVLPPPRGRTTLVALIITIVTITTTTTITTTKPCRDGGRHSLRPPSVFPISKFRVAYIRKPEKQPSHRATKKRYGTHSCEGAIGWCAVGSRGSTQALFPCRYTSRHLSACSPLSRRIAEMALEGFNQRPSAREDICTPVYF